MDKTGPSDLYRSLTEPEGWRERDAARVAAFVDAIPPVRDPHRGGDSYEASMLRNLLARIHRDGGQYVEQHGLDKALEDAEATVAMWSAAKNEAETNALKAAQEADELRAELAALREHLTRFTPLRAKGVVDADDNLDCWDTNPYEICTRHVATLNEKDPAAMWRVVDLFARDEG